MKVPFEQRLKKIGIDPDVIGLSSLYELEKEHGTCPDAYFEDSVASWFLDRNTDPKEVGMSEKYWKKNEKGSSEEEEEEEETVDPKATFSNSEKPDKVEKPRKPEKSTSVRKRIPGTKTLSPDQQWEKASFIFECIDEELKEQLMEVFRQFRESPHVQCAVPSNQKLLIRYALTLLGFHLESLLMKEQGDSMEDWLEAWLDDKKLIGNENIRSIPRSAAAASKSGK